MGLEIQPTSGYNNNVENECCGICFDERKKIQPLHNGIHPFCLDCITKWLQKSPSCPICREPVQPPKSLTQMVMERGGFLVDAASVVAVGVGAKAVAETVGVTAAAVAVAGVAGAAIGAAAGGVVAEELSRAEVAEVPQVPAAIVGGVAGAAVTVTVAAAAAAGAGTVVAAGVGVAAAVVAALAAVAIAARAARAG